MVDLPKCACGCGLPVSVPTELNPKTGITRERRDRASKYAKGHSKHWRAKQAGAPLCACGCGERTAWGRGRQGWAEFVLGHHMRMPGHREQSADRARERMGSEANPMKRPEVAAKISGDQAWRNRPENAARAREVDAAAAQRLWIDGRSAFSRPTPRIWLSSQRRMENVSRILVSASLGRALRQREVVHHIDNDNQNNAISNLHLFHCHRCHMTHHRERRPLKYVYDDLHTTEV